MLSKEEITHIAGLARIRLTEDETEKYRQDLSQVLDFFRELESVDTEGVVVDGMITGKENGWREDIERSAPDIEQGAIKSLFPDRKDDYLKVKSVF